MWKIYCDYPSLMLNKKHLKNVGPIRHCEPFYIAIHQVSLLSHAATVTRRLHIDVHDNDHNNDIAWQRGPLWPHRMGPMTTVHALHSPAMTCLPWQLGSATVAYTQLLDVFAVRGTPGNFCQNGSKVDHTFYHNSRTVRQSTRHYLWTFLSYLSESQRLLVWLCLWVWTTRPRPDNIPVCSHTLCFCWKWDASACGKHLHGLSCGISRPQLIVTYVVVLIMTNVCLLCGEPALQ